MVAPYPAVVCPQVKWDKFDTRTTGQYDRLGWDITGKGRGWSFRSRKHSSLTERGVRPPEIVPAEGKIPFTGYLRDGAGNCVDTTDWAGFVDLAYAFGPRNRISGFGFDYAQTDKLEEYF